jgi:hypothetical protein
MDIFEAGRAQLISEMNFLSKTKMTILGTFSENAFIVSNIIWIFQLGIITLLYLYIFQKSKKRIKNESSNIKEVLGLFCINVLFLFSIWLAVIVVGDFIFTVIEKKSFLNSIEEYINYRDNAANFLCGGTIEKCSNFYGPLIQKSYAYNDFKHFKVLDLIFYQEVILLSTFILSAFSLHRFLNASPKIKFCYK